MRMFLTLVILGFLVLVGQCLAQERLTGDINGDGKVDFVDFVLMSENYGRTDGAVFDPANTVDTVVVTRTRFVNVRDTVFVSATPKSLSEILVREEGWNNVHRLFHPEFVRVLTRSARDILAAPLEFPLDSDIIVGWTSQDHAHIHYARKKDDQGRPGRHLIMLSVHSVGTPSGYTYTEVLFQFAHEYAHVLSNYYMRFRGANSWFQEAICDVASLYVIRKLDRMIQNNEIELLVEVPGRIGWVLNANLRGYLTEVGNLTFRLEESTFNLEDFRSWFRKNRQSLHRNPYDIPKQIIVVANLIDIFEEYPQAWNTIRYLNIPGPVSWNNEQPFDTYLDGWHQRTPSKWQPYVAKIADRFGYAHVTEAASKTTAGTLK